MAIQKRLLKLRHQVGEPNGSTVGPGTTPAKAAPSANKVKTECDDLGLDDVYERAPTDATPPLTPDTGARGDKSSPKTPKTPTEKKVLSGRVDKNRPSLRKGKRVNYRALDSFCDELVDNASSAEHGEYGDGFGDVDLDRYSTEDSAESLFREEDEEMGELAWPI